MPIKPHESEEYQNFLISDERDSIIPSSFYELLIPQIEPESNLLDFGCGLGFVAFYYALKYRDIEKTKFYGCDYQEDLLDLCWKKATQKELKNTTFFYTPDKSRINFPEWLPKMNHIILSFSLSCVEEKDHILLSLSQILAEKAMIHIIEWEKDFNNKFLNEYYKEKNRISLEETENILEKIKFNVIKKRTPQQGCYSLSVSPQA
ncbi:MAG: class I SAM-dependent methyltransferase [Spirochaetia bacterium]|nr:class I SAM-dependent methyltransferase [Spirochaetia bacterium]